MRLLICSCAGTHKPDVADVLKVACSTAQAAAQITPVLCKDVPVEKDAKNACQTSILLLTGASALCSQLKSVP